ncbi:hypothetical protein B0A75_04775 [Flavobacterium oncorhynchi]|uniref:Uncharacterized protein n=1 Tax=Flavobacterium oncorhynchi TaxID=728056 RepID=A0A226I6U2_9FLAO|nr:hypothetical protein [Flavobacterium oncorhynchi]OXB01759.1 hypothetical protein B0A75_04775 [Flavobacterium oncorhynchi]
MITLSLIWSNVKIFAAIVLVIGIVWIYKDKEFYRAENVRQSENVSWLRKYDSLRFSNQVLSSKEIEEHITYNDPELKKKLEAANIKINRIESLVSQTLKYRDTSKRETDISGLIDAIKNSIPKQQSWIDTTECMTVKGIALFDGQKLKVAVTDRQFNNKSDGVVYWQRRQWKFLGIKTRLLGKKEFTSTNFDECGESRIMKIEKKK